MYDKPLRNAYILDFHDWFAEQLYRLDGEAYADASVEEGEYLSSDLFLYARCAPKAFGLANGRVFYERVKAVLPIIRSGLG